MKEVNILKDCKECGIKFQVIKDDLLPIEGYVDSDQYSNHLEFVCKCPYCGEINELSEKEKSLLSLETMKKLMMKYAHCSNHVKQMWTIEKEIEDLTIKLANLTEEKKDLRDSINFAMHNASKEYLYNHWSLTEEVIRNEEAKRKRLALKQNNK